MASEELRPGSIIISPHAKSRVNQAKKNALKSASGMVM